MKLNNKRVKPYVYTVYLFIGLLFVFFLITKLFPLRIFKHIPYNMPLIVGIILYAITKYRGSPLFEYDSDGEALNFKNEDVILSNFISSPKKSSEFPKRKLISYKIKGNFLKKILEITITSKKSNKGYSRLKYNLSYLSKKEITKLHKSLDKVLEKNKTLQNEVIS